MPQFAPGDSKVAANRRKALDPSRTLDKVRDVSDDDVVAILGHRTPGAAYPAIHPPLSEIGEPEDPMRELVKPTEGAAAGDLIRYIQFTDSMYFAPMVPYVRSWMASTRFRGVDPGTLSGRQIIEARERDLDKISKMLLESEAFDPARSGVRGCTVHGHSLRLDRNGMMFDMLGRSVMNPDGTVSIVKDQVGKPLDKAVNVGKPMSDADLKSMTTTYRVDGEAARADKELITYIQRIHTLRTMWGFNPLLNGDGPRPLAPLEPGRAGFERIRFNVWEKSNDELQSVGIRGVAERYSRPAVPFNNDEAAARYYLGKVLTQDERSKAQGLAGKSRAEAVPDAQVISDRHLPLTKTRLVQFDQTKDSIPIFGSLLNVELDENRELIGVSGEVASVEGVSSTPSLSDSDALKRIESFSNLEEGSLQQKVRPAGLRFFYEEEQKSWHLVYFFKEVPAAPKEFIESALSYRSHERFGRSPGTENPLLNFLIDAHDGRILLFYSATPLLDVPVKCWGSDVFNIVQEFFGRKVVDGFEMADPLRSIKTYDHQLKDLERDPLPAEPVKQAASNFDNKAAVSAHVNATRVYDFFKSVLMRDGIDDNGMDLISIVNCTWSRGGQEHPEWHNAGWEKNRMLYGQNKDDEGELKSFSRFLDIIAHELTHGVTKHTSDLMNQDQTGALSESFSDIFGVIINNWWTKGADSVNDWDWGIGAGLRPNGLPLRDMSDPRKTNHPDHMNKYVHTRYGELDWDFGGVHTNCNIHNKAAYNLLTAKDDQNNTVFTPRDIAMLYYLSLIRLKSTATFSDILDVLVNVAATHYAGNDFEREKKVAQIKDAYQKVGIT